MNGSYKDDDDPIGKLMHDFRCTSSEDMYYPLLAKQVRHFKEKEGGRKSVCKAVEELVEKRAEESVLEDRKRAAKILLSKGNMSVEEIAEVSCLSIEEVEELVNLS